MASDGGQDWLGLVYLFLAGIVSIAVDVVRRLTARIGEPTEDDHPHRRESDAGHQDHYHRRKGDEHPRRRHDDEEEDV